MLARLLLTVLSQSLILGFGSAAEQDARHLGLSEFFSQLDTDRDGQIQAAEAMQYIGKEFGDAEYDANEVEAAAHRMESHLDSSDSDATVSQAEIEAHLRNLMQARESMLGAAILTCYGTSSLKILVYRVAKWRIGLRIP